MSAPPLQLPGYHYDPLTKKYYKILRNAGPPTAPPALIKTASLSQARVERDDKRKRKKARTEAKGKKVVRDDGGGFVRARDRLMEGYPGRTVQSWKVEELGLRKFTERRALWCDCLTVDDGITCVSFDDLDNDVVRVGTSGGVIATGSLSRGQDEGAVYPNDEQGWRTSWMFPAKITSLKACGDRLLATCFGPPAQALVGTTSDSISLASVTLKPQKTSLWSSALSPSIVALGCDRKVLISRDPTRHSMDGITTGGRHGDGAVFGLDLTENLIFAGTRGGKVKVFDLRASGSATEREQAQRPEVHLSLPTSVTSVHRIQDGLLVSGIDGTLAMYDLRFPTPKPSRTFVGHVNSYSWDLGIDVWRDKFVAVAGQDRKIRIFSLRTGTLVTSSHASSIQNREFEDSIKALCWGPEGVGMNIPRRDDGYEGEEVRRKWEDMGIGGGKGPSLWIGDGEVVKGFSVEGLE